MAFVISAEARMSESRVAYSEVMEKVAMFFKDVS